MPLHILLILVIGGISGIAVVLHLLGLSKCAPLDDRAARQGWKRHFPEDIIHALTPNATQTAALVQTDHGPGIVWRLGADTVARRITGAKITPATTGLRLSFPDFGAPKVDLPLTQSERTHWQSALQAEL